MSIYASVTQMKTMLANTLGWLDKAGELAKQKKFEPDTLLTARLAPDQYSLVRQLQAACDTAKLAAARLAGKEAPKHPDTEATFDEIRTRIRAVVEYLESFREADFAGADTRTIVLSFFPPGKGLDGGDYVDEFVLPNFYFHATTAYSILRNNGVDLGKRDFIRSLNLKDV